MFRIECLVVLLLSATVSGCGGQKKLSLATVEGSVTYKGKPVEGASVTFQPDDGKPATGVTNKEGRFTLTTYEPGDGAVVGSHKVTIVPVNAPSRGEDEEGSLKKSDVMEPMEDDAGDIKSTPIPQKYADMKTSGLTFDVKSGGENTPAFVLED